jgi:hypothetical protein
LAVWRDEEWFLRWDFSPLGYLSTAAHGHCDALHLSVWFRGRPLIIDPGTGAYYTDKRLRDYLASWDCHNGPHPVPSEVPQRMGTFLWANHHETPRWKSEPGGSVTAELRLPAGVVRRTVGRLQGGNGWQIEDVFAATAETEPRTVEVFWQFAPGTSLEAKGEREYQVQADGEEFVIQFDSSWQRIEHGNPRAGRGKMSNSNDFRGICSPAFRQTEATAYIRLGAGPAVGGLRTVLLHQ